MSWGAAHAVPLTLAGIVLTAASFHTSFAVGLPAPWVMPDELVYTELARSLASGDGLRIRGEPSSGFAFGYPALLSPVFAAVPDLSTAYAVVKVINGAVMSLAAIPVFLLARRVSHVGTALAVAALSVVVPSMAYTGLVMTEALFYPVFLAVIVLMTRCVERPTTMRQLVFGAGVVAASTVRPQAMVLFLALPVAAALQAAGERNHPERSLLRDVVLRVGARYAPGLAFAGLCVGAYLIVQTARGGSPLALPGIYAGALRDVTWSDVPRWFVLQVLELNLYVGPLAAVLAGVAVARAIGARRHGDGEERLLSLAAVSTAVSFTFLVLVATFSAKAKPSAPGYFALPPRIHERYLFYLVPLILILCFAVLPRARSIPRRALVAAVCVVAAGIALIPFEKLRFNANFETFAILPYVIFDEPAYGRSAAVVVAGSVALGGLVAALKRSVGMVFLVHASYFVLLTVVARLFVSAASASSGAAGFSESPRWVDDAVPEGDVAVLWSARLLSDDQRVDAAWRLVWQNEFFNRRVSSVYHLDAPLPYALPAVDARLERDGRVVLRGSGVAVKAEYVLALEATRPRGAVVARDDGTGMVVVRTFGPIVLQARPPRPP